MIATTEPAYLAEMWRDDDLAIFWPKPASKLARKFTSLEFMIHITTQILSNLRTIWTAGYNGHDERATISRIPQHVRDHTTPDINPNPTTFDGIFRYNSDQVEKFHGFIAPTVSHFSQLIQPNNRAMATGRVIGTAHPNHEGIMKPS